VAQSCAEIRDQKPDINGKNFAYKKANGSKRQKRGKGPTALKNKRKNRKGGN
jgi:hypothetical protein